MNTSRRGFTLIELLVVIAIIAILAAILFPVFAKVREKARQTSCLSNEKQIGLAFAQYYEDYDEKWPAGAINTKTPTYPVGGYGWAGELYQYIKSAAMLKCPDDNTPTGLATDGTTITYPVSYAFNSDAAGQADATFTAPASTVAAFEVQGVTANVTASFSTSGVGDGITGGGTGYPTVANSSYSDNGTNIGYAGSPLIYATGPLGRTTYPPLEGSFNATNGGLHTGGSNYLLADGHAKWLRGAAVSPGRSATTATDREGVSTAPYTAAGTSDTVDSPAFAATFSLE